MAFFDENNNIPLKCKDFAYRMNSEYQFTERDTKQSRVVSQKVIKLTLKVSGIYHNHIPMIAPLQLLLPKDKVIAPPSC